MKTANQRALFDLKPREKGRIVAFTDDRIACKMMMMGVRPGAILEFVRRAPFRGGCYIKAGNAVFALRRNEAECILLETKA